MAAADFDSFNNAPYLNPNEQDLLLNALKSNKAGDNASASADSLNPDLTQLAPDSSFFDPSLLESDFPTDFDWDLDASTIEELRNGNAQPSSNSADGDDASPASQDGKRKEHPDDDDEDESPGKRRDSDGKVAKKPGRKPLTSEPTSKRKAQNRAAQRAFRERKEKHLRDLETKVEDLEKASEATNHENGVLRAQVDRLNVELSEYRKRIGSSTNPTGYSPTGSSRMNWDLNSNFNFEFPAFGSGSESQSATATKAKEIPSIGSPSPHSVDRSLSMSTSTAGSTYFNGNKSGRSPTNISDKSGSTSESPASLGLGSSCVTTPEATADSPMTKTNGNTFGSTASPAQPKTPGQDATSIDWFGAQNNSLFDPILFGDYEETQKNILNNADLSLSNLETFPWNLDSTTSGVWTSTEPLAPAAPPKKSLMEQVEQAAQGSDDALHHVRQPDNGNTLTCAKLWDRVQRSEKVLSGEADMDDLCSQLKAKAKCGGPNKGAVVDERDVDAILGPDPQKTKKPTGMWSMFS